jgi:hypothetical protein
MLQYAACIGRRFDTATLLTTLGQDKAGELADSLWQAMTESLIHPLDENYRFLVGETTDISGAESDELLPSLADLLEEEILFEFQHDRVQQAAIAMLDERQLKNTSLQIGWLLLKPNGQARKPCGKLVTIVDRLNRRRADRRPGGCDQSGAVEPDGEQPGAPRGVRAASSYLSAGIQLMPVDSWQDHYTLALELYTAGAEISLLNGDLARAEVLALEAEANARSPLEKARLMKIRMDIFIIRTQLDQVVELGIAVIKMLGFDLEVGEPPVLIPEQVVQLPEMTDPHALMISSLDELFIAAGYARTDPRLDQIVRFYINLYQRFGHPPIGKLHLRLHGHFTAQPVQNRWSQGCLAEDGPGDSRGRGRQKDPLCRPVCTTACPSLVETCRECIRPLYESFQPQLSPGTCGIPSACRIWRWLSLFVGNKLEQVRSEQAEALRRVEFFKNVGYTQRLRMWSQVVVNLMGETPNPQVINGELFGEDEAQKLIDAGQNLQYIFYLYTARAFLSLLFGQPQQAVEWSAAAEAIKMSAQNYLIYTLHLFIYSLALLSSKLDAGGLAERLEKVEENLRLMRLWAGLVPENFLHQLELVQAEKARCLGHDEEAAEGYERAVQEAKKNGYIHECALAAELAEFSLAREILPRKTTCLLPIIPTRRERRQGEGPGKLLPDWLPPGEKMKTGRISTRCCSHHPAGEIAAIDLEYHPQGLLELPRKPTWAATQADGDLIRTLAPKLGRWSCGWTSAGPRSPGSTDPAISPGFHAADDQSAQIGDRSSHLHHPLCHQLTGGSARRTPPSTSSARIHISAAGGRNRSCAPRCSTREC